MQSWIARIKKQVEEQFLNWGHWVGRFGWLVIAVVLLLSLGLASQVPKLGFDTTVEAYLRKDDPIRAAFDAFRRQYGEDQFILLAVEPPELFNAGFLEKLARLHSELETEVPGLADITSLVNARVTRGVGEQLIVEDLLQEVPRTPEAMAAFRERVHSSPLYVDSVISQDYRATAIIIKTGPISETAALDQSGIAADSEGGWAAEDEAAPSAQDLASGSDILRSAEAAEAIAARYEAPDFHIQIGGSGQFSAELERNMRRDMGRFFNLSLLVIAVLLFGLFRRKSAVLFSLIVVILALISTLGIMSLCGIPMTMPMQILPSFLLAVGVGYAVHFLSVFFQRFDRSGDRASALAETLAYAGIPIVMTGLTTMVGLASFVTAQLAPIATFGVFAPIGVGLALIYSLVLLPALVAVSPLRPKPAGTGRLRRGLLVDRMLSHCGEFAIRYPKGIVVVSFALVVFSLFSATKIDVIIDPLRWLPAQEPFPQAIKFLDARMGGSMTVDTLFDTGRDGGVQDPEFLHGLEKVDEIVAGYAARGELGRTFSLADIVKETNKALHGNDPAFYTIPDSRELVAQELLLFENAGSDDVEQFADSSFRTARVNIHSPWRDGYRTREIVNDLEQKFNEVMEGVAEVRMTGSSAVLSRTMGAVTASMVRSYAIALILITPLMIFMIGSLRGGSISMIPNLFPLVLILGIMGVAGIYLDAFTLQVGCIAIGLAVDDTIHFIHSYLRHFAEHGDAERAVRETMDTTGRAMLFASLVLASGFYLFMYSSMENLYFFGFLTGTAIVLAFLADVLLTPALMLLFFGNRSRRAR